MKELIVEDIEVDLRRQIDVIKELESLKNVGKGTQQDIENAKEIMVRVVEKHPVYQGFLKYIKGVDAVLASYILGYIRFDKIENVYQIYSYAGLIKTDKSYNQFLNKKLINSAKYMIKKVSPYSIYYWQNLKMLEFGRQPDEIKNDFKDKRDSEISMLCMFLCDTYEVYRRINNIENIVDTSPIKHIYRLFDYNMFIFDNLDDIEIIKKLRKLKKYERLIDNRINNLSSCF